MVDNRKIYKQDSSLNYMKKNYKLKKCPKCGSYDVKIETKETNETNETNERQIIGWSCQCTWIGKKPLEEEVSEDQYLKYAEDLE